MQVRHEIALPENVIEALQRGDTIEAIKRLRESTGLGLKEARDRIDQHLRGDPAPASVPGSLPPEVVAAMRQGRKIEAIRLLRERTGLGLKDAKEAVESIRRETPGMMGGRSPIQVEGSRNVLWLLAVIAVAALLAWYFFRTPG
jgi:ribosomal protein L7/L12